MILKSNTNISPVKTVTIRKPAKSHETFGRRWAITPEKSTETINATTQWGVCMMLHQSLSRVSGQMTVL